MNSIGFKIKKLRGQKNISQEQLSYELDISQSNLSRIENGTIEKVDFLLMQKVCDFFNVDAEYFFNDNIVQTNTDNKNSAITIYGNPVVNFPISELLENALQNQEQISQLIEMQNRLIETLISK